MTLIEQAKLVRSRADFIAFVDRYAAEASSRPEEWTNTNIRDFLKGLKAFATEMDGYYFNTKEEMNTQEPSWRLFADMLLASRVYEG